MRSQGSLKAISFVYPTITCAEHCREQQENRTVLLDFTIQTREPLKQMIAKSVLQGNTVLAVTLMNRMVCARQGLTALNALRTLGEHFKNLSSLPSSKKP